MYKLHECVYMSFVFIYMSVDHYNIPFYHPLQRDKCSYEQYFGGEII